jgi:hypothetical protein
MNVLVEYIETEKYFGQTHRNTQIFWSNTSKHRNILVKYIKTQKYIGQIHRNTEIFWSNT